MRFSAVTLALLLGAGCRAAPGTAPAGTEVAAVFSGAGGRWVDLTHAFSEKSVYWPTDTLGFTLEQIAYGPTPGGFFYAAYRYAGAEHGGTHLDAPVHFAEGRQASDEIPLSSLIGPAAVVDVSGRATADYQVSVDDLLEWEAAHGRIPDGAILLVRTGWGERYGDRAAYLGTDRRGPEAVPHLHFPGLAPEAAEWLVANRSIDAFGIDTPSLDYGQSTDFRTHVTLNGRDIPGFENVTELEQLPPVGSFVVALPMKIAKGSGGPLRIVAFVPGMTGPGGN
jgi:kynurenine formamidase